MAGYFEEMGWRPLGDGEQPNHLIHMARFLIDYGYFEGASGEWPRLPPPASKDSVENLPDVKAEDESKQCPICLKQIEIGETLKQMPCLHMFHPTCILTWLAKTNTCPCCRFELPTENKGYEHFKKEKERTQRRQQDLDTLHSSMFS